MKRDEIMYKFFTDNLKIKSIEKVLNKFAFFIGSSFFKKKKPLNSILHGFF